MKCRRALRIGLGLGLGLLLAAAATAWAADPEATPQAAPEDESLRAELKNYPCRIVHETYRDGRWALVIANADGSNPALLTRTPGASETYPHVSPDGKKICFECEEGEGKAKRRNVYMMNMDGSGRTRLAEAGRDPCWTPDGKAVVYLKDEVEELQYKDFATKGVFFHDLATGKARQHVNQDLYHLYNVCCTPDGKWFFATVHAGMGFKHAILAIEAEGRKSYSMPNMPGCRPDVSPDGKKIAWGADDCILRVADLDLSGPTPKAVNPRDVVTSANPIHIYHIDWSPDSRYVAFSRGPTRKSSLGMAPEVVGVKAEGWNTCVADAAKTNRWVQITTDGNSNKEPDWAPVAK